MTAYTYSVRDTKDGSLLSKFDKISPLAHLAPGVSLLVENRD